MRYKESGSYRWLCSGDEVFPALLAAIESARASIRFETYIFADCRVGREFRNGLVRARQRGVRVQVLLDSFGSITLPAGFWEPLRAAGGEVAWFNPPLLKRLGFRDHRKMLVCDETGAFIGGFNIAHEYEGDGVKSGWFDLGLQITGHLAADLARAFDEIFARAAVQHRRFAHLRRSVAGKEVVAAEGELLLSGPGRSRNPFKRRLRADLSAAREVRIICAYFVPTWRIRRSLLRIAHSGGLVQLILPAKSDVLLSLLASRSLYRRLLRAGVEVHEYQPQILHAKLILIDGAVYVGSANLDPRSLYINYELMVRLEDPGVVAGARAIFERTLAHSRKIEPAAWRKSRTWWRSLRQRWAYFLLVRVDPVVARWRNHHPGR